MDPVTIRTRNVNFGLEENNVRKIRDGCGKTVVELADVSHLIIQS